MLNFLTPRQQRWRQIWPSGIIALLATIQLLLTLAIVGLEATSMIYDFYHAMIFAGFYCSLFFTITWISMFTVSCCNRHSSGCALHAVVENILSIIGASVILYFDTLFLGNPYTCLFGGVSDCNRYYNFSFSGIYNSTNYTVKMMCIKAQLACAAVMLLTNVIYIIIYIVVSIKTSNESNQVAIQPYSTRPQFVIPQHVTYEHGPAVIQQHTVQCHNCHTLIQIA